MTDPKKKTETKLAAEPVEPVEAAPAETATVVDKFTSVVVEGKTAEAPQGSNLHKRLTASESWELAE